MTTGHDDHEVMLPRASAFSSKNSVTLRVNIETAGSNPEFGGAAFLFLLLSKVYGKVPIDGDIGSYPLEVSKYNLYP